MTARADAAAATGERVLDAAEALFWEQPAAEPTLQTIARRAGVSVQTVIRRFGGREGVRAAAISRSVARVGAQRAEARPGDVAGAVAVIVEHYEQVGDGVLRMLAEEDRSPALRKIVDRRPVPGTWPGASASSRRSSRPCAAWSARGGSASSWPSATSTPGSCCVAIAA